MSRDRRQSRSPHAWFWALAYAAALMVIAPSPEMRHADDYHYLEASLQMSQGGNWIVPRDSDGAARLVKPGFTYWPMAASFKAFGPSMLAARLPFVLAGALTVWLIAWFGARLADRESGRLAAMFLAACLPWMLAGLRTIPDVWLVLFLTLSAGGFLLLLNGTHRRLAPWLAWLGLGLAVATGGLTALLVLPGLAVAWWLWRGDVVWRDLLHRPAVMAGVALGLLWYAAVAIRLGPSALFSSAGDQVHAALSVSEVVEHGAGYLVFFPIALLPFSFLALGLRPADWRWLAGEPGRRLSAGHALVYTAVLILVSSFAYPSSGWRYLMPALPWLALLLGMLFRSAVAAGRPGQWLAASTAGMIGALALVLVFGIAALGVATGLTSGHETLVWRAAVFTLVAVAVLSAGHARPRLALVIPALMTLALPPVLFSVARPALPDAAREIVAGVARAEAPEPVLMADEGSLAGMVRILSAGRIRAVRDQDPPPDPARFGTLVIAREHLEDATFYAGCDRLEIARGLRGIRPGGLLAAVRAGEGEAFVEDHRQAYVMITCPDLTEDPAAPVTGP